MLYGQTVFTKIPKKTIHLDLYVDESKNRTYTDFNGNTETITYIMIMAVPKNKKDELYQKLNNARCLSEKHNVFDKCNENCRFHCENNGELHYTEIQKKNNVKYKIADRWLDILLENNIKDQKAIYFNILGVIETNLDIKKFGDEKQFGNIYCRFFRTCLLRVLAMFKEYDQVVIDNIFHDKTTEMETHSYFNTNAIKQIRMQQLFEDNKRIFFQTNQIEFIDSNHHKGDAINSQFIQFVDIILGTSLNAIHNTATNTAKKELSFKIKPLIERILSDSNVFAKMNSSYNFFNKQSISFFPKISKENLEENVKGYYSKEINFDKLLENSNYFSNTKTLLLKEETGQLSLFN